MPRKNFDPTQPIILSGSQNEHPDTVASEPKPTGISRRTLLGLTTAILVGLTGVAIDTPNLQIGKSEEAVDPKAEAERLLRELTRSSFSIARNALSDRLDEPFKMKPFALTLSHETVGNIGTRVGDRSDGSEWFASVTAVAAEKRTPDVNPEYIVNFGVYGNELRNDGMPSHEITIMLGGKNERLEERLRNGSLTISDILGCVGGDDKNGSLEVSEFTAYRAYSHEKRWSKSETDGYFQGVRFLRSNDSSRKLSVARWGDTTGKYTETSTGNKSFSEHTVFAHNYAHTQINQFSELTGVR